MRHLIRSLADDGTTVFVSSHLLSEVEQLCSHVAVMSVGRLVAQGTLDELRRGNVRIEVRTPDVAAASPRSRSRSDSWSTRTTQRCRDGPAELVSAALPEGGLPETITAALVAAGVRVRGVAVVGDTLESRFVALTGEGFDVAG